MKKTLKNKTFNLSSFKKRAYYEDAKALVKNQTRNMMNCYKYHLDKGLSSQDAIFICINDYQDQNDSNWSFKYAANKLNK